MCCCILLFIDHIKDMKDTDTTVYKQTKKKSHK